MNDSHRDVNQMQVDSHFSRRKETRVCEEKNIVYSSAFNFTRIRENINRFYIVQVLECESNPAQCYYYTRRGRTGEVGRTTETGPMPRSFALDRYASKVEERLRHGYKLLQVKDSSYEERQIKAKINSNALLTESKLSEEVQKLLQLLFDLKIMNDHLKYIGYDCDKMPFGTLAPESIEKGYIFLKYLLDEVRCIERNNQRITELSEEFYSRIPHAFKRRNMNSFLLNTEHKIREKLEMLHSLQELRVYSEITSNELSSNEHELDALHRQLEVDISVLTDEREKSILLRYIVNTHAHDNVTIFIQQIYKLHRFKEGICETSNHMLLWHGSRLTNFVGILKYGLRIAPASAPTTGYMFGKGIYFTDVVSKAAKYCNTNTVGCLLLCDVALGRQIYKTYADYYAHLLPPGVSSVKGIGRVESVEGEYINEVYVPNGKLQPTAVQNTALKFNEYVVYDPNQINIKYILTVQISCKE